MISFLNDTVEPLEFKISANKKLKSFDCWGWFEI